MFSLFLEKVKNTKVKKKQVISLFYFQFILLGYIFILLRMILVRATFREFLQRDCLRTQYLSFFPRTIWHCLNYYTIIFYSILKCAVLDIFSINVKWSIRFNIFFLYIRVKQVAVAERFRIHRLQSHGKDFESLSLSKF